MKNLLFLFICLSIIACRKVDLNLDDREIPVQISENLTGNTDCNFDSSISSCESGFALIDLCIECSACLTDDRLEGHRTVDIYFESLPRRDGQKIATVLSGPNYDFQETICVPVIEGQESQIIGFSLKNPAQSGPIIIADILSYVVFDNVRLNKNGTTKYRKDIVAEDLWNEVDCDSEVKIAWERDPFEVEDFTIDYTYCIVGSIASHFSSCTSVSTPRNDFDLEDAQNEMIESYRDNRLLYSYSLNPCSGIYVSFD